MNVDHFTQPLEREGVHGEPRNHDLFRLDADGEEDELLLLEDDEERAGEPDNPWKVLIVDDDEEVHQVTRLVLSDLSFDDRPARFVSAFNGHQARARLSEHPDVALVLLDVVMEREDAGLHLVRHIREELDNRSTRIILRTGQAGRAPERHVILHYDINDYREKTEFTSQQLYTSVISSLRAYKAIRQLEEMNQNLEAQVEARTGELRAANEQLARARDQLQMEHDLAKEVFRKVVPPGSLDLPGLCHWRASMDVVNGDVLLAARRPGGGHYLLAGDFTGHGLSAAIGALPVAQVFYRQCRHGRGPARIVAAVNDLLRHSLPTGIFFAACLVEIDEGGRSKVWNGGFPDALRVDHAGRLLERIPSHDLALGIVPSDQLSLTLHSIEPAEGSRLILYSDGVIEATGAGDEAFGEGRLLRALEDTGPGGVIDAVRGELERFRGERPQSDDITLVELCPARAGQ